MFFQLLVVSFSCMLFGAGFKGGVTEFCITSRFPSIQEIGKTKRKSKIRPLRSSGNSNYGKGSEIWPPTNQNDAISLEDSFPRGELPGIVTTRLAAVTTNEVTTGTNQIKERRNTWLDRFAFSLVFLLVFWIRPMDVGLTAALTMYTAALSMASQSLRGSTNMAPTLPNLPPQGHVPYMVQNPMQDLTYSFGYDLWWRCGILLGFFLPILSMAYALLTASVATTVLYDVLSSQARPTFLLSCQAVSELVCKDWMLPLPIRIWIPISYQVVRLVYLSLALVSSLGWSSDSITPFLNWIQILLGFNFSYTLINVFGFLLPVALMKYMRAHFFSVEAASVVLHNGMEETVGLSLNPLPATAISDDIDEESGT